MEQWCCEPEKGSTVSHSCPCHACSRHGASRQGCDQSLRHHVSQLTLSSALHAAKGVQAGSGDGEGHADLELLGEDLPTEVLHKFPHLAGCTAIQVPPAVTQQASCGNAAFLGRLRGLLLHAASIVWRRDCQFSPTS